MQPIGKNISFSRPVTPSAADQPVAHVFSRFDIPLRRAHRTQRGRTERHNPHHCLKPAEHCQPAPMGCKIKKVRKLEGYEIVTDRFGGGAISSAPGTRMWCRLRDLNPRPTDYKSVALPAELSRPLVCEERYSNVLAFFAESLKNTAPRGETPVLSVHAPRPQAVNRCRSGEIGLLSEG